MSTGGTIFAGKTDAWWGGGNVLLAGEGNVLLVGEGNVLLLVDEGELEEFAALPSS